jgi:hypothetical protein
MRSLGRGLPRAQEIACPSPGTPPRICPRSYPHGWKFLGVSSRSPRLRHPAHQLPEAPPPPNEPPPPAKLPASEKLPPQSHQQVERLPESGSACTCGRPRSAILLTTIQMITRKSRSVSATAKSS